MFLLRYILFCLTIFTCLIIEPANAAKGWSIESKCCTITYDAQTRPSFDMPLWQIGTYPPYGIAVNYLTWSVPVKWLYQQKRITFDYTVTATGTPWFDFRTNSNNTCNLPAAGQAPVSYVRLMIWIAPNLSNPTYRYWSTVGVKQISPGTFHIEANLDPALWTDVYGKTGSSNPAAWDYIMQRANAVGVTFGGGCFYGHGVFVDKGSGTAKFRVDGMNVQ